MNWLFQQASLWGIICLFTNDAWSGVSGEFFPSGCKGTQLLMSKVTKGLVSGWCFVSFPGKAGLPSFGMKIDKGLESSAGNLYRKSGRMLLWVLYLGKQDLYCQRIFKHINTWALHLTYWSSNLVWWLMICVVVWRYSHLKTAENVLFPQFS